MTKRNKVSLTVLENAINSSLARQCQAQLLDHVELDDAGRQRLRAAYETDTYVQIFGRIDGVLIDVASRNLTTSVSVGNMSETLRHSTLATFIG